MDFKSILIFCAALVGANAQFKVVCYWQAFGPTASQIDPFKCTHIIYTFLGMTSDGTLRNSAKENVEADSVKIDSLVSLKAQNPNLKTLVAFGGQAGDFADWSATSNSGSRLNFAQNILAFLGKHNLDGVDIDWEFPAPSQKANFIQLLQQLKQTLGPNLLVTAAIGAGEYHTTEFYSGILSQVSDNVDFINLMTYDLHGSWNTQTGLHSALRKSAIDTSPYNIEDCVQILLNNGVPKAKIMVGLPTYSQGQVLQNPSNNGVGAATVKDAAPAVQNMFYNVLCLKLKSGEYSYRYDDVQKSPYAFSGTTWYSFDDVRSITDKVNYIRSQNLGGAMVWSLDSDDFNNVCSFGKYPLVTAMSQLITNVGPIPVQPSSNTRPTQPTVATVPTPHSGPPSSVPSCSSNGFYKDPADCKSYYQCFSGTAYHFNCAPPTVWNDPIGKCDHTYNSPPCSAKSLLTGDSDSPGSTEQTNTATETRAIIVVTEPTTAQTTGTTTVTTESATIPTSPQNTPPPSQTFTCPGDGYFKDPQNCKNYYQCASGTAYKSSCNGILLWSDAIKACNWPDQVQC